MATQTKTLNPHALRVERTYDFLYDPIYAVSGQRDHSRATVKAQTDSSKLKLLPIYRTMFSELRNCPRYQLQYDPTDPVPKSVPRQWRGFAEQARDELIQQRSAVQASSGLQLRSLRYGDQEVSGKNRAKFFRRPIIPFLQQVPPDVVLDTSNVDPMAAAGMIAGSSSGRQMVGYGPGGGMERPMTPLVRTMFTQTDYRDSEAQTDPYTPEYVIRPGSAPELLTLATLSHGHGLPAGLAEVEMIERARAKRAWEAQLPPLSDMSQSDKRRRMMEDMERSEWALREREIEKLQEARLEVLKRLLVEREERHQEMNSDRLDRLWSGKQEDKAGRLKNIRHEHLRLIRKLTKKCKNVEGKYERRDIIDDFSNFESQSYAPLTRIGVFIDKGSEQFVVKSRLLNTYEGLLELENTMPMYVMNPHIRAPHPRNVSQGGHVLRKYRKEKELAEVHQVIKDRRVKTAEPEKPLRFLKKIERPAPRPPTPAVEVPSEVEEERELATIFLQKLIRGRAVQNMMFEGKEKRIELIGEMRSTDALQEAQQQVKKEEKQMTLALQRQRRLFEHKESFVDEVLAEMEGASGGDMLDFLSKELVRLQEERRIHAFCMLAERDRRLREAAEAGRRQLEERRRREEDEIFKQVISVHQRTVDTYLEDIILNGTDATADRQAREEIQEMAKRINDVAYDIEENRTQLQSEEIVAELVHGFLLPEVQKETVRERVQRYQRHHLLAAHKEIHKTGEEIIATVTPRKRNLPPTPRAVMVDFPIAPEPIVVERTPFDDGEETRDEETEQTLEHDELKREVEPEEREEAGEMDEQQDADQQDKEPESLHAGVEDAEKEHQQLPTETFPHDMKVIKGKINIDAVKEESVEIVDKLQLPHKMEAVAEEEEEEEVMEREQSQVEEVHGLRDLEQEEEEQPKEEEVVAEDVEELEQPADPETEMLESEPVPNETEDA